jgi:hypothetical protein
MRNAGEQEQIHSSSNHTLGFHGYLGEIRQQSMLPAHGTSPAFMVSLSTLSVCSPLSLGRDLDPRRSQTRATKLAGTPMFINSNFFRAGMVMLAMLDVAAEVDAEKVSLGHLPQIGNLIP